MARVMAVDLRAQQARWAITPDAEARLAAATPPGWTVKMVSAATSADGDGGKPPSDESLAAVRDAEAYFGFGMARPLYDAAHELKWVHTAAAGVGSLMFPAMRESGVIITNSAGIHAVPIAEQALAGILALLRGLDVASTLQREGKWSREPFLSPESPMREVGGLRALVIGAGGLGQALGTRLSALGVRCVGSRRRVERGVPAGFETIVGPDGWRALLPTSDILALCAPSTSQTHGMIGETELAALPRHAIVVNVARGALLDEASLVAAIRSGHVRGAVLDVFAKEPLPAESPLWELPSVILTPHVSGVTDRYWEREMDLFVHNWLAYDAGTVMRNVVDQQEGY